jgi:antitoxin CptB
VQEQDKIIKKILYISEHRGTKEMDLIMGGFTKSVLSTLSIDELNLLYELLCKNDIDVYSWVVGNEEYDKKYSELINQIRKFKNIQC